MTASAGQAARGRIQRTLQDVFGIAELRPGQQAVIERVLDGCSTLAVMPTGAGKSLCYQLPAVLLEGCTLVVSPLIALMKDQCEKLDALGVRAVQLNSHCTADDIAHAEQCIADGSARVVLTTPERLAEPAFQKLLKQRSIALLVVDEAHCIAAWGHDFRPAFLEIGPAVRALGKPTVLALTATASAQVADEVMAHLGIPAGGCVDTGTYRPNLRYAVEQLEDEERRQQRLLAFVEAHAQHSGIVYTATVATAQAVHALLAGAGHAVGLYHGKLGAAARRAAQDAFMGGGVRVMVATNAFGMGIDRPDIRYVVHCQMPAGLDAYYQESGRAGRDGMDADCLLLFLPRDRSVQNFFLAGRYPGAKDLDAAYRALLLPPPPGDGTAWRVADLAQSLGMSRQRLHAIVHVLRAHRVVRQRRSGELAVLQPHLGKAALEAMLADYETMRERDRTVLEEMVFYAQTGGCRWQVLLAHLDGEGGQDRCGRCDNCERIAAHQARAADAVVPNEAVERAKPAEPAFAEGTPVRVRRYGAGTVVGADALSVTIEFADGTRRCFHPAFVRVQAGRRPLTRAA